MTAEKNREGIHVSKSVKAALCTFLVILFFVHEGKTLASGVDLMEGLNLPEVKKISLKNGIKIFYIHDELPKVNIIVSLGFGRLYEDRSNAGLSDLIVKTLSLSGSAKYPGNTLHEAIDSIGGEFSISTSWENIGISIKVLMKHSDRAFDIISDIMANPNFDEKHIAMAKSLLAEELKRKWDSPETIAFEKSRELIFDGSGYGAVPTAEITNAISKNTLAETWKRYANGGNTLIGISSGDNFEKISELTEKHFLKINPGVREHYTSDYGKIRSSINEKKGKIFFYPKNVPQSTVVVSTYAPDMNYEGKYALTVMNFILGHSSFNSRLGNDIRVKRGLAYAVQSVVRQKHKTGVFIGFAQTKTSSTDEVLGLLLKNIDDISKIKVSDDELTWSKNSIYHSFIFAFDTVTNLLNNFMNIDFYGLPDDYYMNYPKMINRVTSEDVLREGGLIFRDGLIKVVVGSPEVRDKLEKFGEVVILK